ncbi:MAG: response regulator [Gammaproteobacteria bacterium]|nr:response regulator [Gammaproteobacteria bacterium]MBU0787766.1 response regulator [Gammaproteobacteria bacterium]MBU0816211.1 response regulator [Gammaproteobacteria bacterium]MBU1786128.1 response regulator [Gammaproteobacteria bacterium]
MKKARVLLIEDDATLSRFVDVAFAELPVDLTYCKSVAEGLQQLAENAFNLILTDLMLPGDSGLDLMERLANEPHLQGNAKVVVWSGGMTQDISRQLKALGAWRILIKPVPLRDLQACVRDALHAPPLFAPTLAPLPRESDDVVELYFNGNVPLYTQYRQKCLTQFEADVENGDAALARDDLDSLRHLAHSLKSVLMTLGFSAASQLARELEVLCGDGKPKPVHAHWHKLRLLLLRLSQLQ